MSREYFNKMASKWDETVAEKDSGKLKILVAKIDLKQGESVLDVGSGTGIFIPFLLEKIGKHGSLTALEHAEEMLKIAKAKSFEGNITYICAGIEAVPVPDSSFDTVVCYSSFPHFQDKPRALAEIYRVLKKGGKLNICHTSCRDSINEIHRKIAVLAHVLIPSNTDL
jgi:ubiquinone/menaquinone biosynthesis C-methylase UbiE